MTETALPTPAGIGEEPAAEPGRLSALADAAVRSIGPVVTWR